MTGNNQRRLAAIVSADVVGYSRLMGVDEIGTLDALRAHRAELIDAKIAEHGGRIVKTMGDGLLLEFPSVVNATQCVIEVQEGMIERNREIEEDRQIVFRVGVNLGDIVIDGEDIHGDGVNIAARLQEISEPGGIALSNRVYEDVRDRLDAPFNDAGQQTLKNIARPVHVWRFSPGSALTNTGAPKTEPDKEPQAALTDEPSIAVLPFDNMSRDPEHEYFADGMAEDIITALSKISRMRVIARNSTFAYKGQAHDLRQVAADLGVRFVLEGSVRSSGNRLRITAQLIDAGDGSHVWAERFDRTIDDIFEIQDEIAKEIVTALRVNLTDGEEARVLARGTENIEAWQLCVRATDHFLRFSFPEMVKARELAEMALQHDPNYAYAWATLGFAVWWNGRMGSPADVEAAYARAGECADRALALDDALSWANGLSAMVAGSQGYSEDGVTSARHGVELNPGNADMRAFLGIALTRTVQYREAVGHFRGAMSLNPFPPHWYRSNMARALTMLGEFDEALSLLDEIQRTESAHLVASVLKAFIFGQLGKNSEAEVSVKAIAQFAPNLRLDRIPGVLMINDADETQRFIEGLRTVDFPE